MKTISANMVTHLAQNVTTLAWCWKATRADGKIFGFTSHDFDLVIGGIVYVADSGLNASNAQAKVGTSVDNLEVAGMLDSSTITEEDLRRGLWDNCSVIVSIVNWKDTTQQLIVQTGTLGDITAKKLQFTAEMRSLTQSLQGTVGRIMGRRCDATIGDARCGVNLATHTTTASVSSIIDSMNFVCSNTYIGNTILPNGVLTWASGSNIGAKMEVKNLTIDTITLTLPVQMTVGDTFSISSGCDKNFNSTRGCSEYLNQINFRGFPHIPGNDKILEYPDAK